MSGALRAQQMKEDVLTLRAAGTHLGGANLDLQMGQYVYIRKSDGVYIVKLKRTWEKLLLAARPMRVSLSPGTMARELC
ncbi:hypothetical protein HPG69_008473 [Diceros bicornis minor]|uniref:Uncharacterized protein n=1 Tax=Diceros bicornis minor TaxID=77932 RepID=A0A7J7FKV5_DICBM|nr:hypothetical protein HPG69_008473 [Diceros bicornis minor]